MTKRNRLKPHYIFQLQRLFLIFINASSPYLSQNYHSFFKIRGTAVETLKPSRLRYLRGTNSHQKA